MFGVGQFRLILVIKKAYFLQANFDILKVVLEDGF
jgi:hypothetical protein